ncbi:NERD domain-containing protein [Paenibacillus sp. FSL H7-0942]|uniref:NERD domain-containing protein n=1 Tax=Paenibacillus sp. FSL H7-0942 TaxID=2921444 RepID=UPI00324D92CA
MSKTIKSWFKLQNDKTSKKIQYLRAVLLRKTATKKFRIDPSRIGELGEHKINIQLDQLPKDTKYISHIMIMNPKLRTGHSQIDHVVISPFVYSLLKPRTTMVKSKAPIKINIGYSQPKSSLYHH